jgi:hypothetical protein
MVIYTAKNLGKLRYPLYNGIYMCLSTFLKKSVKLPFVLLLYQAKNQLKLDFEANILIKLK